jgi:hypothetical protein
MIIEIESNTVETCFDIRRGQGVYPLPHCTDAAGIVLKLHKRCGGVAVITVAASGLRDGFVCFRWGSLLDAAKPGRYLVEIFDGLVKIACTQIQLDHRSRVAGAQQYCTDPCG